VEIVYLFRWIVTDESLCVDRLFHGVVYGGCLVVVCMVDNLLGFRVEKLVGCFELVALFLQEIYVFELFCLGKICAFLFFLLFLSVYVLVCK